MRHDLPRQFAYDQWANQGLLDFMLGQPSVPERARQLYAHMLAAQKVWLHRIEANPEPSPVWPDWPLPVCQTELKKLTERVAPLLPRWNDAEMARDVNYRNSQGQAFANKLGDILQHVLYHGAYHRGQIATHLRQAGLTPPATDFILAAREGLLG